MALVGLLAVCAVASEETQSEGEQVIVSLRELSTSEVVSILNEFPQMVPFYADPKTESMEHIALTVPLSELTAAPLVDALPGIRFYKGLDTGTKPAIPFLIAIAEGKRYGMPNGFNPLLLDNDLEVNPGNVLEMARAFVVLAVGAQHALDYEGGGNELLSFPQIAFVDATEEDSATVRPTDAAVLKVKTGAQTEEWHFSVARNQFDIVSRRGDKGPIKNYFPVMVESLPGRR